MSDTMYADIGYQSLLKDGQFVCGDHVERIDRDDGSVVLVLADGLGSGVRACILSTLTSTILSRLVAEDIPVSTRIHAVVAALPISSVLQLAYSTFTVINISPSGRAILIQYDNPGLILFRDGQEKPIHFLQTTIEEKTIESAEVQLQEGDVLMVFSDGAENAGVGPGMSYVYSWGRDNIAEYMAPFSRVGFSAKTLNTMFLDECSRRYGGKPGDDTTSLTVCMRTRKQANLLIGPPANRDDDDKMLSLFFAKQGRHIVCGGSTARLAAQYLNKPLTVVMNQKDTDDDIPALGRIEGVDLVTEGIITLQRGLAYAQNYLEDNSAYTQWCYKRDGAAFIARMLFEEATDINFFVGRAANPAHQSPDLPLNFSTKMQIVYDLSECLKKMGKTIRVSYF